MITMKHPLASELEGAADPAVRKSVGYHLRLWPPTLIVLAFVTLAAITLARNPKLQWNVVGRYLFTAQILGGVINTLELTAICFVIGGVLGILLAAMRISGHPALSTFAGGYSWLIRSIPPLVQLIFWYNLALILPRLWWPFAKGGSVSTNTVISGFSAAILGLALNEAAYIAEIVRGGIRGVSPGEIEAAKALGMRSSQIYRQVTLPQAIRIALPPLGNQVIALTKLTSLVAFIGGSDLLSRVTAIYGINYEVIPLLIVASIWYLVLVTGLSLLQMALERRRSRGNASSRKLRSADTASALAPIGEGQLS